MADKKLRIILDTFWNKKHTAPLSSFHQYFYSVGQWSWTMGGSQSLVAEKINFSEFWDPLNIAIVTSFKSQQKNCSEWISDQLKSKLLELGQINSKIIILMITTFFFRSARASCTTFGGPARPYTRTQWKSWHLYIQAYMPQESSGDSSNQPIGHMGSPRRLP